MFYDAHGSWSYRKRLESQADDSPSSRVDDLGELIRDIHAIETQSTSALQTEVPPWAESYEISVTEADGTSPSHAHRHS